MKVKIEYSGYSSGYECWAKAEVDGKNLYGCGDTWKAAKESLIRDIRKKLNTTKTIIPPSEEVEIEGAVHAQA